MHSSGMQVERAHDERDRAERLGHLVLLARELDGVLVAGEREDVDAGADAGLERPFAQTCSRIDRVGVIEHAPQLRHLSHPR